MNRVFLVIAQTGNMCRDFISEHRYHVPTLVAVVRTYERPNPDHVPALARE